MARLSSKISRAPDNRYNGPEGTRTPDLKLRKLAHYPSCATGPKKLSVDPL